MVPGIFPHRRHTMIAWGVCISLGLVGCGSDSLPTVTGHVTLDGKPLADADVTFKPEADGTSPALGRTDAEGNYRLEQGREMPGVHPGKYVVRITTYQPGISEIDPPVLAVREKVPIRYNMQSELAREVKLGDNVFDFPLDSRGPKYEPRQEYF